MFKEEWKLQLKLKCRGLRKGCCKGCLFKNQPSLRGGTTKQSVY
jgi:hypothetical protein